MLVPTIRAGFALTYLRYRLFHCHTVANTVRENMGLAADVAKPSFRPPSANNSLHLSQSLTTILSKLAKYDQNSRSLLGILCLLEEESNEASPVSHIIIAGDATALVRTLIVAMSRSTESSKDETNSYT
jgi:hypothetical protein